MFDAADRPAAAALPDTAAALRSLARRELRAAIAVVLDAAVRDPTPAAVHVARGWTGLEAARGSLPAPAPAALAERLDAADLSALGERAAAEWRRTMPDVLAAAADPTRALPRALVVDHCRWLERALAGRPASRAASGGFRLAAAALLAALAAVSLSRLGGGSATAPWRAQYFPNMELLGTPVERLDESPLFDWGDGPPLPGMPADEFSVRWTSCLVLSEPTELELGLGSDDGARVFVDGRSWVDGWGMHDFVVRTGKGRLDAGAHEVRVEFFDKIGPARVALWAGFGGKRPAGPIPPSRLRPPAGEACR